MSWMTTLELTYRAYVRAHRQVEDQFDDVINKVYKIVPADTVTDRRPTTSHYLPIDLSTVDRCVSDGKLIVRDGGPKLVVREWVTLFDFETHDEARMCLDKILQSCGHVFTNIRIIDSTFTDVNPQ
jgi:hypothetical protein